MPVTKGVVQVLNKQGLWTHFCARQSVTPHIPLFESDSATGAVHTLPYGKDRRLVLMRSEAMEQQVIYEVEKVLADYAEGGDRYDGLIYMMFWEEQGTVLPLYIGKSEKYGVGEGNLSANIAGIRRNTGKFCRWGYAYFYHLGDLSAVVCPGHPPERRVGKYARWAERLFADFPQGYPSASPRLVRPVWFWVQAWPRTETGIWREWGATSLTFLEYLLIGAAAELFPDCLLNTEGVTRGTAKRACWREVSIL
jgi:hypothetical protein